MLSLPHHVSNWLEIALFADLPFSLWEEYMFNPYLKQQFKRQMPSGRRRSSYSHAYVCLNRPLSFTWARQLDPDECLIANAERGVPSYVACQHLLDPQTLYDLELYPLLDTRAATLAEILEPSDLPLTMVKTNKSGMPVPPLKLAILSRDTRTSGWRVTWFEEEVGPVGHTEAEDEIKALAEMMRGGYRKIAHPTLLDEIAPTFPEQVVS